MPCFYFSPAASHTDGHLMPHFGSHLDFGSGSSRRLDNTGSQTTLGMAVVCCFAVQTGTFLMVL